MPGRNNPSPRDPASGRPVMRDVVVRIRRETKREVRLPAKPPLRREFKTPSRRTLYFVAGGVLIFTAALLLLDFFARIRVVVTPRQEFVEVSSALRASASSSRDIALEVISLEDSIELEREVTSVKSVEEKARGQVVIYNAFSSEPQPLVASTRLEAPNGNIYRITSPVTVPGAKTENGKLVPQGIEVAVFADKPGEAYNLSLSDFSIPGFKGTSKFEKFYGRSKTEITGGVSGERKVVSDQDVKALVSEAQENSRARLGERARKDLPAGVFLLEGASELETKVADITPPPNSSAERFKLRLEGTLRVFALKESELSQSLGRSYLALNPGEEVQIANREALGFEIVSKNFDEKTLTLRVKGRAHFVWTFDAEALRQELATASRQSRKEIFQNYPAIERAEIHFQPAWWRIFPDNTKRIKIEITLRAG